MEWIESIVIALVLAIFIRSYFVQPFKIPSGSMRMTLVEGDHLFVNKLRYGPNLLPPFQIDLKPGLDLTVKWPDSLAPLTKKRLPGFGKPERGDVIVFVFPEDRGKDFIKRLIGRNKNMYYYNRGDYGAEGQVVQVPQGYVYVLGDNSASSHDSRYWGFVPVGDILGKAEFIFWPPGRIRLIQ
jgi:signal peptidase I